jgi:hypothetical protein
MCRSPRAIAQHATAGVIQNNRAGTTDRLLFKAGL